MKVLLINPPFYRLLGSHYNGFNLGLGYVAADLKAHGHEVAIYNADYLPNNEYLSQHEIFNNFESYIKAHELITPIWGEVFRTIASFKPDVVGISMTTAAFQSAQNVAEIAKHADYEIKVAIGGPHVTLAPRCLAENKNIDLVISSEGEGIFASAIAFDMFNKSICSTSRHWQLDTLAFPLRDAFIGNTKYMDLGNIITGRGCPCSCTFCASPAIWNRKVSLRSIGNVLEEIQQMLDMGINLIHFCDDTFNLYPARTVDLLVEKQNRNMDFEWICDARADRLDEGLVNLMAVSGCKRIKLGIESGSERMLKRIKKGITVEEIKEAISLVHEYGIPLTVYLMAGFPEETDEDLLATIKLAKWIDADYYSVSLFTPYYGTELWNKLQAEGKLPKQVQHWEYFYHQSKNMMVNDNLDDDMVQEFLNLNEDGRFRV